MTRFVKMECWECETRFTLVHPSSFEEMERMMRIGGIEEPVETRCPECGCVGTFEETTA